MRKRQNYPFPSIVQPGELQLLDVPEVAKILRIGRTKVYHLIKTDGLPIVKVGSATRIPVAMLQQWIAEHTVSKNAST